MKKRLLTISVLAVVLLTIAYFSNDRGPKYLVAERQLSIDTSLNQKFENNETEESENPIERLEFEMGQLVNPETGKLPDFIRQRELNYAKKNLSLTDQVRSSAAGSIPSSATSTSTQTVPFASAGPYNVGGRTRAVALDVNDESIILAGAVSGGMWRSIDSGATWSRTTAMEQHPAVSSLVQDKRSEKTNEWYYSTGERRGNSATINGDSYVGNGIYKSVDNGASWSLISATAVAGTSGTSVILNDRAEFALIDELAIDYSNTEGTEIYAAGTSEILRSADGFETFDIVLGTDNTGRNSTDIAITTSGKVYATIGNAAFNGADGADGFFKSEDGITWTDIEFPENFPSTFTRLELGIDPSDEDKVYVLAPSNLFLYNDASGSWTDLTSRLDVIDDGGINGHNAQGGYNLYVAVHPDDSEVVFAAGINLLRSLDAFTTDAKRKQVGGYRPGNCCTLYPNQHPDNHDYYFFPSDGDKMITATDGGSA